MVTIKNNLTLEAFKWSD